MGRSVNQIADRDPDVASGIASIPACMYASGIALSWLIVKSQGIEGLPFGIREPEGRPLRHVEIREAQVVPEWCPLTHI